MKYFRAAALLQLALAFLARASPLAVAELALIPMTYIGPITPGGDNVTLEGTAQEIHKQIKALNPAFNPMDFEVVRDALDRGVISRDLTARTRDGLVCNIKTPGYSSTADPMYILDGIAYLNSLPGACGAAGHHSTRLSCSYSSAIFMVVNNNYATYAQCQYLADLAQDIYNACEHASFGGGGGVNGQESDSAGYVVIVAYSPC